MKKRFSSVFFCMYLAASLDYPSQSESFLRVYVNNSLLCTHWFISCVPRVPSSALCSYISPPISIRIIRRTPPVTLLSWIRRLKVSNMFAFPLLKLQREPRQGVTVRVVRFRVPTGRRRTFAERKPFCIVHI